MSNKPTMIQKPREQWGAKEWDAYIQEAQFMANTFKDSYLNKIHIEWLVELGQRQKDYAAWACNANENNAE